MVWRGFPGLPSAGRLKKTNLMFEIAFSNPAKVIQNTIPLRTFRQGPEHSAAAIFGSFQLLRNLPADGDSRYSETLNKCSFSTTSIDKVAPDEISKPTEDTGDDDGIRAVYEEDAAGDVFGRDGAGGAVGKVVRPD
jgi:hypothetical protein